MEQLATDSIHDVLAAGRVQSAYQPIVDLDGGGIVAFEALSRGPVGTPLANPEELFRVAREANRVDELDALCMSRAIEGARGALGISCPLFVNVEPTSLDSALVTTTAPIAAAGDRQIVLEVTERALATAPEQLIRGVQTARDHGWQIALDDVGVEPSSLAFLPILRPDVIKLDMGLIRNRPGRELGQTMTAVMAHSERTGAVLLAEGIETSDHLDRARSLGATLGQGYLFGRPGPLPPSAARLDAARFAPWAAPTPRRAALSPFDTVVGTGRTPRVAAKRLLMEISRHIEQQAVSDSPSQMLLSAFQDVRHFTPDTARRYQAIAERSALCVAVGIGMPERPMPAVRGARLLPGDPLTDEWSVVVLGPHYSGALLGRELDDGSGPDVERPFSFVVTHDRDLVELAAESLLRRVLPVRG